MSTEMKEIYSKFLRLYEKLAEEREVITQQGIVLGKIVEALDSETKLATEFKALVRQGITEDIRKATGAMSEQVKKALQDSVTSEVKQTIQDLQKSVTNSRKIFENQSAISSNWWAAFIVGAFIAAIAVGIIFGKWFIPQPWSDRDLDVYSKGKYLEAFWGKIDKKEREHLSALADHRIPPEKNSVAWIIANNPKLEPDEVERKFEEMNK